MLFELVQSNPTVLGWRFNLERIRRRNVVVGASALSMVIVVFITDLLWSDISKSFHRNCSDNQNNILLKAVLGLGKKNVVEALPILWLKLDKRWPRDAILIVDYGELKHGSIVAKPQKCVFSDCASVHLAATLWKRVLLIVKKTPKMKEIETVEMCSFIHVWMALFNACLTTLMLAASALSAQLHSVLSSLPGHWAMLVVIGGVLSNPPFLHSVWKWPLTNFLSRDFQIGWYSSVVSVVVGSAARGPELPSIEGSATRWPQQPDPNRFWTAERSLVTRGSWHSLNFLPSYEHQGRHPECLRNPCKNVFNRS